MPKEQGRILIIDDDEDVLLAASMVLKKHFQVVHCQQEPQKLYNLLRNEKYDVVLLDMNFTQDITSGREGFFWLDHILKIAPETVVVLFTAYGDVEMSVRAIKEGAFDFVLKPWQNEKLLSTIHAALQLRRSKNEVKELKDQQEQLISDIGNGIPEMVGSSTAIRQIFQMIGKVAATDANVLISGENGTGKELVARALHKQSHRSKKLFMSVDLGALPDNLFESELFGHTKGAFTDAREDRKGRFVIASGGTLFLDEIGNIPLTLQGKLLTVLQNREVTPVGADRSLPIDIRLICATNKDLEQMVQQGEFRQDLLYRINTVEINLPPLRERKEDIPLLFEYFLKIYEKKYHKTFRKIEDDVMPALVQYHWPGNIRELQHAVERVVILAEDICTVDDFAISEKKESGDDSQPGTLNLEDLERQAIKQALKRRSGNISRAAEELGLTRAALYRRMEKYGL